MADALDEDVDLDLDRRRYVLDVFGRLPALTHYELLGIAPGSDKKAIRRAYFELVRTMHPDRYFGKRLGTYARKIEAIFSRMSEAYETLSDPTRRAAYDAARPPAQPPGPAGASPVDPKVAAARKAAMDALKERFVANKARAAEHAAAAERARAAGDVVATVEAYEAALRFAPGDPVLAAAHGRAREAARERLVESQRAQARLEERWGRWREAAESWRRVLAAKPDDLDARAQLAAALRNAKG